jgi:galactokinase
MKDIEALHRAEFEEDPELIATSPGVVKLLGEQTPGAEGLVLAAAISLEVCVAVSERRDSSLRFFAADLGERKRTSIGNLKFKREDRWANYPKAIIDAFSRRCNSFRGFNITIAGEIPLGLGFASSAALLLATTMAFKGIFKISMKNEEVADMARRAEAEFLAMAPRLDDFLTAAHATPNAVTIVDLRTGRRRSLPFFDGDWSVILTDSKVPRFSLEAEACQREEDAKKALQLLDPSGRKRIRDFPPEEIDNLMGQLPESVRRRALHLAEEHQRVLEAEQALADGDAATFGKVLARSHHSLRNLYEVSCPEIDWLQKRASEIDGVLCSRLTGAGFGGCTASIMSTDSVAEYKKRLDEYERIFGFRASLYETGIDGAMRVLD